MRALQQEPWLFQTWNNYQIQSIQYANVSLVGSNLLWCLYYGNILFDISSFSLAGSMCLARYLTANARNVMSLSFLCMFHSTSDVCLLVSMNDTVDVSVVIKFSHCHGVAQRNATCTRVMLTQEVRVITFSFSYMQQEGG